MTTENTRVSNDVLYNQVQSFISTFWGGHFYTPRDSASHHMAAKFPIVITTPIDTTKQFIKLEQKFRMELGKNQDVFLGQNQYLLFEKMRLSADVLLNCSPDKISLQITDEGSIFYTILKNDITIYFQHFLINEFDENDEVIVSVLRNDESILNYGGDLSEAISKLGMVLSHHSIELPVFS